jgi:imidazolonepropionase-like amidohydrolase
MIRGLCGSTRPRRRASARIAVLRSFGASPWRAIRALFLLGALVLLTRSPGTGAAPVLVLAGGQIIDGTGREPVSPGTVVVEGDRIRAVGPAASIAIPPDARTVDISGRSVLPGLINAHVHLTFPHGRGQLSSWLEAGVTTVCDLGSPVERLASLKASAPVQPRVVAAGPIMSVPGGYPGSHWGPEIHLSVQGADDARQQAQRLLDRGADLIKIALEAAGPSSLPLLSAAEVKAIADVAHARGTVVVAHVDVSATLERAVDNGVDAAAHMVRDALPASLITKLVQKEVHLLPTLAVFGVDGDRGHVMLDNVRRFVGAGGRVAFGDDWGNPGTATGLPWHELRLLLRAGMTPMQVIVAATRHSARVCNRHQDLGTLEPGKVADLIVVDGDPSRHLGALRDVSLVVKGGRVVTGLSR